MTDLTSFIVGLFILLTSAVLVGELATRLGQAALVGQLIVGVLLGPTLLGPALGLSTTTPALAGIQFLATFFILVMAGLDIHPESIWQTRFSSTALGVTVFAGPFLVGAAVVPLLFPGIPFLTSLFVSLTLSITALPVMGVMISEFRLARTPLGTLLINTAVINELAAVTVFAVLLRLQTGGGTGWGAIAIASVSVALFLSTVLVVHNLLRLLRDSPIWESLRRHFERTWKSKEAGFALLMVLALGAALYSQFLGLTFLVGAFYAGLLVTPDSAGERTHRAIGQVFDAMTWGFFIPLFFAFVGLGMNLRVLASSPSTLLLFGVLSALALLTKFGFGAAMARLLGWTRPKATAIGFFVSSRGAVELAMAVILLEVGVFGTPLFTFVAAVGLVTTIVAPIGAARFGGFSPAETLAPAAAPSASDSEIGPEPLVGAPAPVPELPLR
jgi:Kef-type K+ transport system membrane component KefB